MPEPGEVSRLSVSLEHFQYGEIHLEMTAGFGEGERFQVESHRESCFDGNLLSDSNNVNRGDREKQEHQQRCRDTACPHLTRFCDSSR